MADLHAVRVTGTVELSDGSKTEFSIEPDLGWQQWGNIPEKLAVTGVLMDALSEAAAEHVASVDEDDDETGA